MPASAESIHVIARTLNQQGYIDIPAKGKSMYPFIRSGDVCRFEPFVEQDLSRGDILLFIAPGQLLIGHRYLRSTQKHGIRHFVCKGDSNIHPDLPLIGEQILGKLRWIRTGQRTIQMGSGLARLWGEAISGLPWLSYVIQWYLRLKRKMRRLRLS
ncbi:hypothetical protein EBB07_14165 [Paenibacillaceae bacterium]|nr:hypothetical protein EBB07_14165 [Paenibacillaceae bacterium]